MCFHVQTREFRVLANAHENFYALFTVRTPKRQSPRICSPKAPEASLNEQTKLHFSSFYFEEGIICRWSSCQKKWQHGKRLSKCYYTICEPVISSTIDWSAGKRVFIKYVSYTSKTFCNISHWCCCYLLLSIQGLYRPCCLWWAIHYFSLSFMRWAAFRLKL